jgi:hypothetical protein
MGELCTGGISEIGPRGELEIEAMEMNTVQGVRNSLLH